MVEANMDDIGKAIELNIGGHDYKIIEIPLKHEDGSKELYGRHLVKENVILINKDIAESRKKETLIHEVLHAIFYNTGLEHDERQIEAISNGLFQLGVGEYLWKKSQKKSILKAKEQGNTALVQRLQQELDELEKIRQNLNWDMLIRELEDVEDKEDFPKNAEK